VVPPRHSRGGATTPGPPQWLADHPNGWVAGQPLWGLDLLFSFLYFYKKIFERK
jgi:hypothetical protein